MPKPSNKDLFAAMAAGMDVEPKPDMEPVPAPRLSDQPLPTASKPSLQEPKAFDKLDSPAKLDQRVAELRRHYASFLEDCTPPNPEPRPRLNLSSFRFRFETPEDLSDVQRPYSDEGDWEAVEIPHYRGPVGPWAAYYRTSFPADATLRSRERLWLHFRGVDYKCQVFVNGRYVGGHEGLFAPFAFDVTDVVNRERENILLIRIENDGTQKGLMGSRPWQGYGKPTPEFYEVHGDKVHGGTGQGWDSPNSEDWNDRGRGGWTHCPPGAGIWQPVFLEGAPTTRVHDLFVRPFPEQGGADLWLETFRSHYSRVPTEVELTLYPNNFKGDSVEIGRREVGPAGPKVSLYKIPFQMPEGFRWWTLDEPCLYTLRVRLICTGDDGTTTEDVEDVQFGMRSFRQDTAGERKGTFLLNGEPILLRGTNEMGNLSVPIQQGNPEQAVEDLLIGKAAHMNFWRITQRPVQSEVYELCDRLGVLFQTDLPLFGTIRQSCVEETARQAGEMERLIRRHPGAILSSFINEPTPERNTESLRHRVIDRPTMEDFFEVCIRYTRLYNPDRIWKCCDGDYDAPPRHGMLDQHAYVCMHEDHGLELGKLHKGELFAIKKGWTCGVGEYGAEGLEPLPTMRKHYPADWLPATDDDPDWTPESIPLCQAWGWHHQWYEQPDTIQGWIDASHHHQEWAVRFMHEGFRRRADIINSTALHLLVNAWPNNWLKALCSVDREPLPGYFAYADANQPLAVNLRTDRHAVTGGESIDVELWLLNDTPRDRRDLRVVYRVDMEGRTRLINETPVAVDAVSATFQGRLRWPSPEVDAVRPLSVHASLLDTDGTVLHDYALSLQLWPRADRSILASRTVAILGQPEGTAWRLAEHFGAAPVLWSDASARPDLVISDSADTALGAADGLQDYLAGGGCFLGLPQPAGSVWRIGGSEVRVRPMKKHQFVSRKTGHPVVDDLDPFHFSFWFHPELDRITHLLSAVLEGENLRPITLTGTGLWYAERTDVPAGAECPVGGGWAVFDQVRATERMSDEPRAAVYLQRLLGYVMDCGSILSDS